MVRIDIPICIFPKPRPRKGKYGNMYTPRDDREDNLESYMKQFMSERRMARFSGNLQVDCDFYVKGKAPCDIDNAVKTIFDCGNNIIWKDDKQIKAAHINMWEGWENNRVTITVEEIK